MNVTDKANEPDDKAVRQISALLRIDLAQAKQFMNPAQVAIALQEFVGPVCANCLFRDFCHSRQCCRQTGEALEASSPPSTKQ